MEDFIPFEIAKKLKEKGFRDECLAYYTPYGGILNFNTINVDRRPSGYTMNFAEFYECYNCYVENNIDAPTISQALKWLREEKKIVITILPSTFDSATSLSNYYYVIYDVKEYFWDKYEYQQSFETYEECEIKAIEYALDNLI